MVGQRPKMLRPMQYLKGPGFEDFVVLVMAVLAVTFFFSDSIHWIFALALALPLFFGTLPKLRLIAEMNRRMADKRKHQPQKESQFTAASKRIRDGTLRRLQGMGLAPLNLNIPNFRLTRTKSPRSACAAPPRSTCSISEPSSPRSVTGGEAKPPRSPIMSPEALSRRLNERLHFNGNKHEFFSRTKFAGCLREDECDELFKLFEWVQCSEGDTLFNTGDSSESGLYMLVEGRLGVYMKDDLNAAKDFLSYHMLPGDSIGDTQLLAREDTSRLCSVRAEEGSVVMQLTRARFRSFCTRHPDGLLLFLRFVLGRLHRVSHFVLAEFLSLPHLQDGQPDCLLLPPDSKLPELFAGSLSSCVSELGEEEELYSACPKHLFVLLQGSVRITSKGKPNDSCREMKSPCVIGARAFWTAVEPDEEARAGKGARVAKLDLDAMLELAGEAPEDTVHLVLVTSDVLLPVIHQFISLGLSRHWVSAGERVFEEGDEADGLYLLITGRVRLWQASNNVTDRKSVV